ncbi:MAG: hypothetical protein V7L20_14975 [Nostoc sp.]|uniref:hypothetical protein n=1 Tax=Nostoc sp. TaxID=1180 RepID=UPI002FFC2222
MRNSFSRDLNNRQRAGVTDVIGELNYNNLGGTPRSNIVPPVEGMRIDRQRETNQEHNIQVQVNNVQGHSTVAAVLIPNRYLNNSINDQGRAQVARQVRAALVNSFLDYLHGNPRIHRVEGHLSN